MYSIFDNIHIAGVATTLPENEIDNLSFSEQFGEDVVRKQIKVTGIKTRRVVKNDQSALDLMITSAKRVMEHCDWSGDDIDVLVYASGYTEYSIPATAYIAQQILDIKESCIAVDINLACTGTVDGLYTIASMLQQYGNGAKGILMVGESPTVGGAGNDKATSMLSSDCGAAVAVEVMDGNSIRFCQNTDGSRYEVLVRQDEDDHIHMEGMEVFQFAITDVVNSIKTYFDHFQIEREKINYYIIHQAQKFIVDKVSFFADFPKSKVINSYNEFGNSGGASDICTLCYNREKFQQMDSIYVFMTGFGAGLSWAMVTADIETKNILPVEFTNEHYAL